MAVGRSESKQEHILQYTHEGFPKELSNNQNFTGLFLSKKEKKRFNKGQIFDKKRSYNHQGQVIMTRFSLVKNLALIKSFLFYSKVNL